jgi:hypothetical protein
MTYSLWKHKVLVCTSLRAPKLPWNLVFLSVVFLLSRQLPRKLLQSIWELQYWWCTATKQAVPFLPRVVELSLSLRRSLRISFTYSQRRVSLSPTYLQAEPNLPVADA